VRPNVSDNAAIRSFDRGGQFATNPNWNRPGVNQPGVGIGGRPNIVTAASASSFHQGNVGGGHWQGNNWHGSNSVNNNWHGSNWANNNWHGNNWNNGNWNGNNWHGNNWNYSGWNRPYVYGRPYFWNYYRPWYHGNWGGWYARPYFWGGFATGYALGAVADWAYVNPYYVDPAYGVSEIVYDYSQPLPPPVADVGQVTEYAPAQTPAPDNLTPGLSQQQALRLFDTARTSFQAGDYATAQATAEQAIRLQPGDAVLHEFRGLTLFAQGKYADAAATLYPVLAAGPGWDWQTLKVLYPDNVTYRLQFDALAAYVAANPQDASGHFLLAYHDLVLDDRDAATRELQAVVTLKPDDKVAAGLLDAIRTGPPAVGRPQIGR